MRDVLEMCVELDRTAHKVYLSFSEGCTEPRLAEVFRRMAIEEGQHVGWWTELLDAWDAGLLPDIADEHHLLRQLTEVREEVEATIPAECAGLSADEMLDIAAHLEFYMLDPVFGELTDLMQPGGTVEVREAYSRHVMRLIQAIENHHTETTLAPFLARVLRRAYRDQQRLAALATRDQLTGLLNRRGLLAHLRQWLSWSRRYGRPVGVALVDVDYFKRINDALGHPAGDDALAAVARALVSATRSSDIVGRFGGDEFLVLAPEADEQEISLLMSRIAEIVRGTPLVAGEDTIVLSVSVGGAWAPGGIGVSPEAIVAAADRSLYHAKATGRDRAGEPLLAGSAPIT